MNHQIKPDGEEQSVFVTPGDTINITLDENPSTGYSWQMEETSTLFNVLKNSFQITSEERVGGKGHRIIHVKIEQGGSGEIRLKYCQRWSGEVAKSFYLKVVSTG